MIGPSLPQRLLIACLAVLLAVLALQYAAQILERIWPTLAIAGGVLAVIITAVQVLRWRRDRW